MKRRVFLLAGAFSVSACAKSIDVAEWREEVKLHDGQMITVWRKARAYSGGFPNASRGRNIDFELRFAPMDLYWQTTLSETHIREPISFELFDGVPHLVLYIGDKASCRSKSPADYSAEFLRWSESSWREVQQSEFPVDRALINLSVDYWGHTAANDYKGLVRWPDKRLPGGFTQDRPDTVKSYLERGQRHCSRFVD